MNTPLAVVSAGSHTRLKGILKEALHGVSHEFVTIGEGDIPCLQNRKVLFALSLGEYGLDGDICKLIVHLRSNPSALLGSAGAMVIDGAGELYTKQLAHILAFCANGAGCFFPGKPLVEGTGSLNNLAVQARRQGTDVETAYSRGIKDMIQRLTAFSPQKHARPKLLMLHASDHATSNTLDLGAVICNGLAPRFEIQELSLQNGTIMDCRGCSYKACAHFAQSNACFYGGAIVQDVFPAIMDANALLLLCPNYNDSVSANIMAFINRLTALLVHNTLYDKYLYAVVVSGCGGDLVAQQVLGALCLNKTFMLPPRFCLLQTANDPGDALRSPGMDARAAAFAQNIVQTILTPQ